MQKNKSTRSPAGKTVGHLRKRGDKIILGIDPGSVRVGVGIIEKNGDALTHIESGLLDVKKNSNKGERLLSLEKKLKKVLSRTKPDLAGVEKLFFSKNQKTAFAVAEARGIILKTLAEFKIPTIELTPSEVKLAVAGNGGASKEAVAKMVGYFLKIQTKSTIDDVTDALALAIAASNK